MTRRYTLERTDFIGCRGRTHALLFIGNLQMPRVYR